jgi:hypothetical protein
LKRLHGDGGGDDDGVGVSAGDEKQEWITERILRRGR